VRRANAKQRALQRESKAHQVNFAELKAAAYAAAKNRRQSNPQQQLTQQQQSLVGSGSQRRSGGEGAALQPVIVEYDQVKLEYFMVACSLLKVGALSFQSLSYIMHPKLLHSHRKKASVLPIAPIISSLLPRALLFAICHNEGGHGALFKQQQQQQKRWCSSSSQRQPVVRRQSPGPQPPRAPTSHPSKPILK